MTHHNHCNETLDVARITIDQGRELRFQPLNQYRKKFRLKPYTSFEELTGKLIFLYFFKTNFNNYKTVFYIHYPHTGFAFDYVPYNL